MEPVSSDRDDEHKPARKAYSRLMQVQEYTFSSSNIASEEPEKLVDEVRKAVMGDSQMFIGPFGERKFTYVDFTASGKPLEFIEDFIHDVVLPLYANTHTTTSVTGHQMTLMRHEARMLIKRLVNANFSHGNAKDSLIFHGTGVTGCINAAVSMLGLDKGRPAVVFVGPYEHHSNLLPWRESPGCRLITIGATPSGAIDLVQLEKELQALTDVPPDVLKIGSFSAASNVTGILTDVDALCSLLHRYGALAFFDYATAAPYVRIDMNPRSVDPSCYKDAVFISPHKFLGGPGTPGILIIKKTLVQASGPINPGGGTVFFVRGDNHQRYLKKVEERQEGGTQDIVGAIRAALAFKIKSCVGEEWIMKREQQMRSIAVKRLQAIPNVIVLGMVGPVPPTQEYLPVLSFVVSHQSGRMLHYNFVCSLLNDLFGLQLRGGCMCAGPFAMDLLGLSPQQAVEYEAALVANDDSEILRPGFCRFNLHYTMTDSTVDFILRAIEWVAAHGWRLLPDYSVDVTTGEWYHPSVKKFPGRRWLADLSFDHGCISYETGARPVPEGHDINSYFETADKLLRSSVEALRKGQEKRPAVSLVEGTEPLRWFVLPQEVSEELLGGSAPGFWKLDLSPLRTLRYTGEQVAVTNHHAKKALEFETAAAATVDDGDFLGMDFGEFEGDEASEQVPLSQVELAEGASGATIASSESDAVCGLPGTLRDPIDPSAVMARVASSSSIVPRGALWHTPHPKKMSKKVMKAIYDYDMIRPGDRVLVCVSGGKDSLSLLHTLHFLQSRLHGVEHSFEIGVVTVDPMTVSFDPRPLIPYMAALGVPYHYEQQPLIDAAMEADASSICSWCSRMKRGIIYKVARREGYNVVAMGQHLDDLAESFMMSFWLNGRLRTQKAAYVVDDGDLRFCRPLCYVREHDLKQFATEKRLPVISETCPACFAEPKERARLKSVLKNQEALYPSMYHSMRRAMDPLMRALPMTVEDRARAADKHAVQELIPTLIARASLLIAGMILGMVLKN